MFLQNKIFRELSLFFDYVKKINSVDYYDPKTGGHRDLFYDMRSLDKMTTHFIHNNRDTGYDLTRIRSWTVYPKRTRDTQGIHWKAVYSDSDPGRSEWIQELSCDPQKGSSTFR